MEKEGFVDWTGLKVEWTKEVWPRKSEEVAEPKKPGWGAHSADGMKVMERVQPRTAEGGAPLPERTGRVVWVELAKGAWPAGKGGSAGLVEGRGLAGGEGPVEREGAGDEAWQVEGVWSVAREGVWPAGAPQRRAEAMPAVLWDQVEGVWPKKRKAGPELRPPPSSEMRPVGGAEPAALWTWAATSAQEPGVFHEARPQNGLGRTEG